MSIHDLPAINATLNAIAGVLLIVGYLALNDEDVTVDMDDADEAVLEYSDPADPDFTKRARLPKVTVRRR